MASRIETNGEQPPKIDFSDWEWDLPDNLFKQIADRIAEIIWAEIVETATREPPTIDSDEDRDNAPCLRIPLFGEDWATLIVPVADIVADPIFDDLHPGDYEYDAGLAETKRQTIAALRRWADILEQEPRK